MTARNLPTWLAAVLVVSLFLGMSGMAQATNPAFPVGHLMGSGTPGTYADIAWSIQLPETENPNDYTFFIRQVQMGSQVESAISVQGEGQRLSPLPIDSVGSRFELAVVGGSPIREYLVDSLLISSTLPRASLAIYSEDPYALLPRTRADRPFLIVYRIEGIRNEAGAPLSSKGVKLTHHVQSYGETGTGAGLNRALATILTESLITSDGLWHRGFEQEIPATNREKARGEERFSIVSLEGEIPESVITTKSIQIWPVADGAITGVQEGQVIGEELPEITIQLNDLYPRSDTYVQVYQGSPQIGVTGTLMPGSLITLDDSVPSNRILSFSDYGSIFDSDGLWTMEVLTRTPFGTDRIAHVSFTIHRFGTPLDYWREAHFGNTENSGNGADLNDYDQDGLPNIVEFAFGGDPKKNSAGLLPQARVSGNNLLIDFTQPEGVSGVTYEAEWSTTLLPDSWIPVSDTGELSQHLFSVPIDAKPQLFMRLKVAR